MTATSPIPDTTRHRTGDEVSAERFALIAARIEADPALLAIPLANIARWLTRGHPSVERLEEWRTLILAAQQSATGMEMLLERSRDQSWEAVLLKDFSPFPGILTASDLARLSWTSAH